MKKSTLKLRPGLPVPLDRNFIVQSSSSTFLSKSTAGERSEAEVYQTEVKRWISASTLR